MDAQYRDCLVAHGGAAGSCQQGTGITRSADGYSVRLAESPDLYTHSFHQGAEFLAERVRAVQREFPGQKIRLVAVCNGGVVAQYYVKYNPEASDSISHLVTWESAHQGTKEAPLWSLGTKAMYKSGGISKMTDLTMEMIRFKLIPKEPARADVFAGLPDINRAGLIQACLDKYGKFSWGWCSFFKWKMNVVFPHKVKHFFAEKGLSDDAIDERVDELLRSLLIELYVGKHFFVNPGRPQGYELAEGFPIFKEQYRGSDLVQSLKLNPLPEAIKATNIYSCLSHVVLPYHAAWLEGAHNVLICPKPPKNMAERMPDEVISKVSLHWSMYYQPFVLDRIVAAIE